MRLSLATKFFISSLILLLLSTTQAQAQETPGFTTKANFAALLDVGADTYLYEKSADARMTPSSMTKLMTVYILFDRLKHGSLKLTDTFHVSEKAWKMGGSKMFVGVNTDVKIEDLIQGIVIQSGNDACVTVAEGISGTEEAFADEMNRMAQKLGMKNSHFLNASGWPAPEHYATARDLAILAEHIIEDFPEYYHYFSEKDFTYNGIHQPNRNALLGKIPGVDGLKTGHTDDGGYGMVVSAQQDGRRLISVVNGLASEKEREVESDRLLKYGFRDFIQKTLFKAGETVDEAPVWLGKQDTVPLVPEKDVSILTSRLGIESLKVVVTYTSPIAAPIEKGRPVAELVIKKNGMEDKHVPLVAGQEVPRLSYFSRLWVKAKRLILHH